MLLWLELELLEGILGLELELELDDEGIDGILLLDELWLLDWQASKPRLIPPTKINLGSVVDVLCMIFIVYSWS